MCPPDLTSQESGRVPLLEGQLAALREQLLSAERNTAQTLMRATRLAQVISVLGNETDLETIVERAAVEIGELFFSDMALLILGSDEALRIEGHWGVRAADMPSEPFSLPAVQELTRLNSVRIGPADEMPLPDWLAPYSPKHVAWARLFVADKPLGLMLLMRRGDEPFARAEENELRAVAHRIALAVENGLLHRRTMCQLAQLHRLQELTAVLAGTLELDAVGRQVADTLVSEVHVSASAVLIDRAGELVVLSGAGSSDDLRLPHDGRPAALDDRWTCFPLEVAGQRVGLVAVNGAPAVGSEQHELLLHLVSLAALALDKALLHEQSREQARHDSLTGLLGHRVFHETLERQLASAHPYSIALFDIDDFKQVNDLHGHQTGDHALRLVADALRQGTRSGDEVFRVGGEEFCALLPGLTERDAYAVAEGLRQNVAAIVSTLPHPLTVSGGVASFPAHGRGRDELLAAADGAMYVSKRTGKNRTTIAGKDEQPASAPARREAGLELLARKDPESLRHGIHAAILSVEIARELLLDDARLTDLRTAAKLHDIGKIAVPRAILDTPGPLDDEQFAMVKVHAVVGAELLTSWALPGPAAIVRAHHERIDGSGYPAGLHGDQIPLESRIIHVADAYLAMTSDRPYRRAMDRAQAFAELERHRGTQFDAEVVDALIAVEQARVAERDEPADASEAA